MISQQNFVTKKQKKQNKTKKPTSKENLLQINNRSDYYETLKQ